MKARHVQSLLGQIVGSIACVCVLVAATRGQELGTPERAERQVKVFKLAHASSPDMLSVLEELFGGEGMRMAADRRTNSLIVLGPPTDLEVTEAVILRLDEPKRPSDNPATKATKSAVKERPKGTASAFTAAKSPPPNAKNVQEVRSELPGASVVRALVARGESVKKGDLLVELDSSALAAAQQKLRIELEQTKAEIKKAEQALVEPQDLDLLRMAVDTARLRQDRYLAQQKLDIAAVEGEIKLAKQTINLMEAQLQMGAQATHHLDVLKAQTQLELAEKKREFLTKQVHDLHMAELQLEIKRAESELQRAAQEGDLRHASAEAAIQAARARYELQLSELERVNNGLKRCRIFAPATGVVHPMVKAGSSVRGGQLLIVLELSPSGAGSDRSEPSDEDDPG